MKCIPITLSALSVWLAISFIEMLEVLLARIASGLQMESSWLKVLNFSSGISGIASTTRSHSESASMLTDVLIRDSAEEACSSVILPLEASLSRELEIVDTPFSRNSSLMSTMMTSLPLQAAT